MKAHKKNRARDRRKANAREEAERKRNALRIIQYYVRLWCFQNATGFMNKFKYNIIDRLLSQSNLEDVQRISNWHKGGGYVMFYVGGMCNGYPLYTSIVRKEFYHELGHFVLTSSGSLYKLEHHQDDDFTLRRDKLNDMYSFAVTETDHFQG